LNSLVNRRRVLGIYPSPPGWDRSNLATRPFRRGRLSLLIRIVELGVPERRACRVLGQHRSTQRKPPSAPDDEAALIGLPP
jgi:hypothetical protein